MIFMAELLVVPVEVPLVAVKLNDKYTISFVMDMSH